ncbi:MAG: autotransporter assembly complex family protein [Desulfobacteraceae bacterium]|jgi:translocation and assembly module TamA
MQTKNCSKYNIYHYGFFLWAAIFLSFYAIILLDTNNSFCAETDRYQVRFKGVKDKTFLDQIRNLSATLDMSSKPAGSLGILRKRVREDIELFTRFLKSEGYFDTEINETIDTTGSPWIVTFHFIFNRSFTLSSVKVRFTPDEVNNIKVPNMSKLGMPLGETYRSKTVPEGEEKLLFLVRKQGFPYPTVKNREITADHKTRSVIVEFDINPGPKAFWGDTEFKGLENVDHMFLRRFIPWKRGDVYDPDLINKCYKEFMDLGLFSTVRISEGKVSDDNMLPVEIEVTERKHNSFSVGLKYHTDEGPGVKFSWENRNLFGHGEKLGFLSNFSNYLTTFEGIFKKPVFFMKEQTLRFSIQKSHEDTDAYISDSYSSSVFLDRDISEKMDVSGGLVFKKSKIDQLEVENRYSLLSAPVYFNLDYSNDLLDPVKGGRLSIRYVPYYDPTGDSLFYNKGLIRYRHYLRILRKPLTVMAGSITLGMIKGAGRSNIPADERFYAGGGGSVRGYPYQSIGPLSDGTPLGGKALIEMSAEARLKVTRKFGLVLFLDGGTAYSEKLFDKGEEIRWGTGIGVRYFTPIGPLRFDAGFPLNRRDGIDDSFQLYISIGQAF